MCPYCKGPRYQVILKFVAGYGLESFAVRCRCIYTPTEHKTAATGERE